MSCAGILSSLGLHLSITGLLLGFFLDYLTSNSICLFDFFFLPAEVYELSAVRLLFCFDPGNHPSPTVISLVLGQSMLFLKLK